jgi:hypothetical protein
MIRTLLATSCALVFGASLAQGAEYFIYRDPGGKIVLSNITPPPGAEVIKREELQDVTDEEVRVAREREHAFWQRLKDEELAESNRNLTESNYRLAQAIITAGALRDSEPDLVQVAVTNAFPFGRFASRRPQQRGNLNSGFRPHSRIR